MKKTEIILIILVILSLILSLFRVAGSAVLSILSLSSLSVFYFYAGVALFNGIEFKEIFTKGSFSTIPKAHIMASVGAGFGLSVALLGLLFEFQSWAGSSNFVWMGSMISFLIFLFSLAMWLKGRESTFFEILKRVALFGSILWAVFLLPKHSITRFQFRNDPEMLEAIIKVKDEPGNQEYRDELNALRRERYGYPSSESEP